jgi:hypothetical protein
MQREGHHPDDGSTEVEDKEDNRSSTNPFDPKRLRIGQRFGEGIDSRPVLASVSVRKPHRQWWVRTHPDVAMSLETCVLQFDKDQQFYLVDPGLAPALPGETVAVTLYTTINMSGGVFLWPVRLPDENGQQHECHVTAHHAANLARAVWIRVSWEKSVSNYAVARARGALPEPSWPEADLQKILSIAFRDRYIDSLEHPVVRHLLGEF